jgi:S1-C subfamily serine protease
VTPTPQEPPEEGPETENLGRPTYGTSPYRSGWIDPDDRLWRHPSELAVGAARAADARLAGIRHPRTMILIGAAATVAAIAWALVLLSPASDQPTAAPASDNAANIPMTTLAVQSEQVPAPATEAGHSVVQLRAVTSDGTISLVGVAVAEGGLVATTASGLATLHSLWMIGPDGRRLRATVLAVDSTSDLALISVPDDIPVAPFADDDTLTAGSTDMALSMVALTGGTMSLHSQVGSVTGIGSEIPSGPAKGMPAITSTASATDPAPNQEPGDPLLDRRGAVIGILYDAGTTSTYLPTQLVLGVADDLRSTGHVSHGWLGVTGTAAAGSGGARVAALMAGSPAAGLLQAGDVIVGMGAMPIRSMADLRGRLYVSTPNAKVALSVVEGTTTRVVDVTLGASP